jgi:hypothetical protein
MVKQKPKHITFECSDCAALLPGSHFRATAGHPHKNKFLHKLLNAESRDAAATPACYITFTIKQEGGDVMIFTGAGREKNDENRRPKTDEYARMDDREKDRAIQKAVIRLRDHVQKILNPLGGNGTSGQSSTRKEVKHNDED